MDSSLKYDIKKSRSADAYYNKAPADLRGRLDTALNNISKNPGKGPHIICLKGPLKGKYRYAMSAFRIIYEIDKEAKVVFVESIRQRGKAYK